MVAIKQEVQKVIKNLPEDCTYEDIQYHLYIAQKIKKSMDRAEKGEVLSHRDAKQKMDKWLLK